MSKGNREQAKKNKHIFGSIILKLFKFLFKTGLIIPIIFTIFYLILTFIYSLDIKNGIYAIYFYIGLIISFICVFLIWKKKKKAFNNLTKEDIVEQENEDKKYTFKKFKNKKYKNVKTNRFVINNSNEKQNKNQNSFKNANNPNEYEQGKYQNSYRNVNINNQCINNASNYYNAPRNNIHNSKFNDNEPKIYRHSKYQRIICFEYETFIEFYCEEENKKLIYLRREDK